MLSRSINTKTLLNLSENSKDKKIASQQTVESQQENALVI